MKQQRMKRATHDMLDRLGKEKSPTTHAIASIIKEDAWMHPVIIADGIDIKSCIRANVCTPPFDFCTVDLIRDTGWTFRKWVVMCSRADENEWSFFTITMSTDHMLPGSPTFVRLNDDGRFIDHQQPITLSDGAGREAKIAGRDIGEQGLRIALVTFSMMHAKNVMLRPRPATEFERRLCRKRKRHPITTYKTLVVQRSREKIEPLTIDSTQPEARQMPHHCVRGHFATYSKDTGLLFGKHSGTFWIPAHIRGDRKHGEIIKDYKVEP